MHQFFSSIRLWLKATAYEIKREVQERVEIFLIPPCIIRNYSSLFSWVYNTYENTKRSTHTVVCCPSNLEDSTLFLRSPQDI